MKNFLMGCGVAAILLLVIVVGGGYWAVNAGKRLGASMEAAQSELNAVNREFPFSANDASSLTETRLAAWLKVREANAASEKNIFSAASGRGPLAMARMVRLTPEALRACAGNLRQQKMSAEEYAWITREVMGALKSRSAEKDPALAELARLVEEPAPEMKRRGFQQQGRRPFAPLGADEAEPVLELIRKHEAEFRKAAHASMSDTFLYAAARRGRRAVQGEDGIDMEEDGLDMDLETTATATKNSDEAMRRRRDDGPPGV